MIRILIFLLLVLVLGLGFAWFADRPGDVVLQWQGNEYQTSLMVVLVGLVAVVAAIMITWWLARTILNSPQIMQRFFKARKKDRGYRALSQGLIAANSGDAASARKHTKESIRLLGREPLVDLLDAQSALLEGNREDARKRFEEMLGDDDTRLVALRGLYLEAERQGAKDAARHYAEEAHKAAPALPWAGNAKLRYASMEGNWEGALRSLEANKAAGLLDKDAAKRQRAVLLTAHAMAEEPADPVRAAKLAREAHKLAPTLVPAAIIGSKALARNSDIGRAAGMIETVWKKEPHPDLAASYVHLRIGDSAMDRLKRAKKLAAMKPNHLEGNFAVAEAAMDAQDWKLARESLKPVLTTRPTERACLLMAEIEEGEFGDRGRMRDWLSRAVRSPKDAAWTADGYVSDKWLPISPVTGRIDAFEWKVPVEQLDAPEAAVLDAEGLEDLIREPETAPVTETVTEPAPAAIAVGAAVAGSAVSPESATGTNVSGGAVEAAQSSVVPESMDEAEIIEVEAVPVEEAVVAGATPNEPEGEIEADGADTRVPETADEAADKPLEETPDISTAAGSGTPGEDGEADAATAESGNGSDTADASDVSGESTDKEGDENVASFVLDRRPDDPGIRKEDEKPKPKRFGIF